MYPVSWFALTHTTKLASTPPKETVADGKKFAPLTVNGVSPTVGPFGGEMPEMTGVGGGGGEVVGLRPKVQAS